MRPNIPFHAALVLALLAGCNDSPQARSSSTQAPPEAAPERAEVDASARPNAADVGPAVGNSPDISMMAPPDPNHVATKEKPFPMSEEQRDLLAAMGRPSELELRSYSLPLNNPPTVPAGEANHMQDSDPVLGLLVGDHARAYPWWIVIAYHVINDTFAEFPVHVAQCEVCSGAGAFYPVIDGWLLDFRVCGAKNGTFFICDFQTKSSWYSFSGISFAGPLEGRQLPRLPVYQTTWGEWRKLHPNTDVIHSPVRLKERPHGRGQFLGKPGIEHQLEMTVRHRDKRLADHELVFGLVGPKEGTGRVHPLVALEEAGGLVQERYGQDPLLLVLQGESRVSAYIRVLDGVELTFKRTQKDPLLLRDNETGTTWSEWGRGVKGPHAGRQLSFANGYLTEWYEWVGHYPVSEIVGLPLKRSSADRIRKSAPNRDPDHHH